MPQERHRGSKLTRGTENIPTEKSLSLQGEECIFYRDTLMESLMSDQMIPDTTADRLARIIAEDVRPWIEIDGGRIEFVRYEDGIVYVRLGGACRGCPATALTLKEGVERRIREQMPDIRSVEMIQEERNDGPDVDLSEITL